MVLLIGVVFSDYAMAEAEFDFEELMEKVDDISHNLQASIANKDVNTTVTLATEFQGKLKLVEGYFAKRGNAADAVSDAKKYQDRAAEIVKFAQAGDFASASNKAIENAKECDNACHDTYKPL